MTRQIVKQFEVTAGHGGAFEVKRGQILQIYQVEGRQVGDVAFFNAHDFRESFHVGQTWAINVMLGLGTGRNYTHFYSKPPRENVMLTVVQDTVGNHFGSMGGRCSRRLYEMRDNDHDHRSCQENLAEALAPYGVVGDDIVDVFNCFMNVDIEPDGRFTILPPTAEKGDHIDLRAEMDILGAISCCPREIGPVNDGRLKPLGIRIFDDRPT